MYAHIIDAPHAPKVWGLTPHERLRRLLHSLKVEILEAGALPPANANILLLRGDVIYDTPIVQGLLSQSNTLVEHKEAAFDKATDRTFPVAACVSANHFHSVRSWLKEEGHAPAECSRVLTENISDAYQRGLRKREAPYCLTVENATVRAVEKRVFMGAYKGVTDLVTKYAWPIPAMWVTRWCIRFTFSPNMVTSIGFILTLAAMWLFWEGQYGAGLVCGWTMAFLDTVDGKLARVTFTSSTFGNIFDHGIDLIHPPFWYIAWAIGLTHVGMELSPLWFDITIWTMLSGYILGRLVEAYFIRRFGFHIHVWRRFDSLFRLILARRNPNMIILTVAVLVAKEDIGIIAVSLWTVATLLVHIVQLVQAEIARMRGRSVTSWLTQT